MEKLRSCFQAKNVIMFPLMLKIPKELWFRWKDARKRKDDEFWSFLQQPNPLLKEKKYVVFSIALCVCQEGGSTATWLRTMVTLSGLTSLKV